MGFCTRDALCQIAHYEPSSRLNIDSVNRMVLKLVAYNTIEELVLQNSTGRANYGIFDRIHYI